MPIFPYQFVMKMGCHWKQRYMMQMLDTPIVLIALNNLNVYLLTDVFENYISTKEEKNINNKNNYIVHLPVGSWRWGRRRKRNIAKSRDKESLYLKVALADEFLELLQSDMFNRQCKSN